MSTFFQGRLAVMADSRAEDEGKNEKIIRKIMEQLLQIHPQPNYIIYPGDLIMGSRKPHRVKEQMEYFKKVIKEYYPIEIFLPTVGNHDVSEKAKDSTKEKIFGTVFSEFKATDFLDGYNRTAYYLDIFDTRLIILNTYHPKESEQISGMQLKWLEQALNVQKQHKLVFMHSPAYPTGHHFDSSLDVFPDKRDYFWHVLDKNNVELVITGHEHNYSRRGVGPSFSTANYQFTKTIPQIISGGAGGPLMNILKDWRGIIVPPVAVHHYVIVDIYSENLHIMAISITGDMIDNFTI